MKIGFIGLGNMGAPMARNLIKAGHELLGFDVAPTNVGDITQYSITKIADNCRIIFSMLPDGNILRSVYEELIPLCNPKTILVDCSTVDVESALHVSKEAEKMSVSVMDAPVSGGVAGAQAGTLTFIVGGALPDFERARPLLLGMGKNVFHAGDHGAGQIAKICNNMLLAVHMIGTAEALQLGVDNGLDPEVLSNIMLQSSGRNWSLELYNPYPGVMESVPASKGYEGGFQVNLMNKDLGLALEAGLKSQSATPMGNLAKSLYVQHGRNGWGKKDFSSIQKWFEKQEK